MRLITNHIHQPIIELSLNKANGKTIPMLVSASHLSPYFPWIFWRFPVTAPDPFDSRLRKPLSYLKSEIRSAASSIWQDNWDNGETGRSAHDIVPRVSKKPVGWNREEIMSVTGHGPFPSYLQSSNT
ncbi:hypothetical protein AVEN_13481-1 [Araneus ventricosus]|uniref:Uncharacterized protein n=1 Tax=Araneus ventricosus TaxID=182803 RepID=A0A4Y2NRR9_ARAVE|nr:hypothetical protein AVEN_13481-1 [Araneus ventricosus]